MFHQGECEPDYPIIFLLEYDRYISCLFVGGLLRKEEGGQVITQECNLAHVS